MEFRFLAVLSGTGGGPKLQEPSSRENPTLKLQSKPPERSSSRSRQRRRFGAWSLAFGASPPPTPFNENSEDRNSKAKRHRSRRWRVESKRLLSKSDLLSRLASARLIALGPIGIAGTVVTARSTETIAAGSARAAPKSTASQHGCGHAGGFQLFALLRFERGSDGGECLGAQGRDFNLDFGQCFRFFANGFFVVFFSDGRLHEFFLCGAKFFIELAEFVGTFLRRFAIEFALFIVQPQTASTANRSTPVLGIARTTTGATSGPIGLACGWRSICGVSGQDAEKSRQDERAGGFGIFQKVYFHDCSSISIGHFLSSPPAGPVLLSQVAFRAPDFASRWRLD